MAIALLCSAGLLAARGATVPAHSQADTTAYVPAVLNQSSFQPAPSSSATAAATLAPTPSATVTPDTLLHRQSQAGGDGLSVAATDNHVFIGHGPRVKVYERTDRTSLSLVGETVAMSGIVTGLAAANGLVYAAATSAGVWVIDVSEPRRPRLLSNVPAREGSQAIAVRGDHAFVAEGDSGIRVLDVTDPEEPDEAAVIEMGGTVTDVQLSASGDLLYVMGDDGRARLRFPDMGHLWVLDVREPDVPIPMGHLPMLNGYAFAVSGDTVYFHDTYRLVVVDASDPSSLRVTAALDVDARPIAVEGNYMYALGWDSAYDGLVVVDIGQPGEPVAVANVPEVRGNAGAVRSGVVFVPGYKRLQVVDVAQPTQPNLIDSETLMYAGWHIHDIGGGLAYVEISPPAVANISDATHPRFTPLDEEAWRWDSILDSRDRTVVALSSDYHPNVVLLDASDPMHPSQLAQIELQLYPLMARLRGERLYINCAGGLGASMLQVYDVADPTNPQLIGEDSIGWIASELEVVDTLAYVALTPRTGDTSDDSPGRLQVLDVADPGEVRVLGEVQFAHSAVDLELSFSSYGSRVTAYVVTMDWYAVGGSGLYVVDVSDPRSPTIRSFVPTAGPATGVVLHGDNVVVSVKDVSSRYQWPLYAGKLSGRGLVYDTRSAYYPVLQQTLLWGSWTIWPNALTSIDGVLWVATVDGGLMAWQ